MSQHPCPKKERRQSRKQGAQNRQRRLSADPVPSFIYRNRCQHKKRRPEYHSLRKRRNPKRKKDRHEHPKQDLPQPLPALAPVGVEKSAKYGHKQHHQHRHEKPQGTDRHIEFCTVDRNRITGSDQDKCQKRCRQRLRKAGQDTVIQPVDKEHHQIPGRDIDGMISKIPVPGAVRILCVSAQNRMERDTRKTDESDQDQNPHFHLRPVDPVQRHAGLHRISHVPDRLFHGFFLEHPFRLIGFRLVQNVIPKFLRDQLPRFCAADLLRHRIQIFVHPHDPTSSARTLITAREYSCHWLFFSSRYLRPSFVIR